MKILIVGEFSGYARHLKEGFQNLGHEVTIVSNGDTWKKISCDDDILFQHRPLSFLGKTILRSSRIRAIAENYRLDRQLKIRASSPDLIIVLSYVFFRGNITRVGVSLSFIENCLKKGARLIMSECGKSCAAAYRFRDYYELTNNKIVLSDKRYSFLLQYSSAIIPTCYMYYDQLLSYSAIHPYDTAKVRCIPLPITINKDYKNSSCVGRKIVVFHGIIRPIDKGTPFIQEAMKRLSEEMPEKVECVCVGGLPYSEYIRLFDRVDILVDQTYGNGWGMNAAIGAMKAKCVLAPCGPENSALMGIPDVPFVRIGPDSNQIYMVLKELVMNPSRVDEIKLASRRFAEQYFNCVEIAKKYLFSAGF